MLERLQPAAQIAQARQRVGALLDRATQLTLGRVAAERRLDERAFGRFEPIIPALLRRHAERVERAGAALPVHAGRRVARARSAFDTAGATLAALGPQATLDRGYAIVRRTEDGRIVRDPGEAPAGTRLDLRVARGAFPATSDRP